MLSYVKPVQFVKSSKTMKQSVHSADLNKMLETAHKFMKTKTRGIYFFSLVSYKVSDSL